MKALLATHAFLWFIGDDPQLSANARAHIEDGANDILLSAASLWEMAIKVSLGKLSLSLPFDTFIPRQLSLNTIGVLAISMDHVSGIVSLPFHHRDPFDRMLIAQALVEHIPIVGRDAAFDAYGVTRIW